MQTSRAKRTVALVPGLADFECFSALRASPQFRLMMHSSGREAVRSAVPAHAWVVADKLVDMHGLACVQLLAELHTESRFFLIAAEFDGDDERRCFQLGSTTYLCQTMAHHWLVRLLRVQTRLHLPHSRAVVRPSVPTPISRLTKHHFRRGPPPDF